MADPTEEELRQMFPVMYAQQEVAAGKSAAQGTSATEDVEALRLFPNSPELRGAPENPGGKGEITPVVAGKPPEAREPPEARAADEADLSHLFPNSPELHAKKTGTAGDARVEAVKGTPVPPDTLVDEKWAPQLKSDQKLDDEAFSGFRELAKKHGFKAGQAQALIEFQLEREAKEDPADVIVRMAGRAAALSPAEYSALQKRIAARTKGPQGH